ncbi:MAG: hypothetical protein REI11_08335 [Patulibacter sp.]|nr:hypothetical protein [Patulibacter sp.]
MTAARRPRPSLVPGAGRRGGTAALVVAASIGGPAVLAATPALATPPGKNGPIVFERFGSSVSTANVFTVDPTDTTTPPEPTDSPPTPTDSPTDSPPTPSG